jgi:hypothetical protein
MNAPATIQTPSTAMAPIIFEAIVRQLCVTAQYNGGGVMLAPHAIFNRHGELYVAAITIARDGNPPREPKVGLFKLDGLGDLALSNKGFEISALFDRNDPRYAAETLMAVEPSAA